MAEAAVTLQTTRLDQARALVAALERGDEAEAEQILDELKGAREEQVFQELCRLTRRLHDALSAFVADSKLVELTENDIPDARERLRYVIALTEQAANTTLNAVDAILPRVTALNARLEILTAQWERFLQREMPYQEFKELSRAISAFLENLRQEMSMLQGQLNEVVMAQSFQDLSGQIIRRVIELVEQAEDSLIELIRLSGRKAQRSSPERSGKASGPAVPGLDQAAVTSQDEVDDLLSSLGF
ncbi:protein phosphatase CheZ [Methylothermus subterraneus]